MKYFKHAMVVGCTGMLSKAASHLAENSNIISTFARSKRKLIQFADSLHLQDVKVVCVEQDYNSLGEFSTAIDHVIAEYGPPNIMLGWFHTDTPSYHLATRLSKLDTSFSFFHILGSESAVASDTLAAQRRQYDELPNIQYHQVVLGFTHTGSQARWLTNAEISIGAIAAINKRAPLHIVGTIAPWSERPK